MTIGMLISLGVGVGTCTTVFGWINATLLEPFPVVARSGEYVVLAARTSSGTLEPLSYPGFIDLRDGAGVFDNLVAAGVTLTALNVADNTQDGHTERVFANFVSGNYFSSLGVDMELGRAFRSDEDSVAGRDAVVVISHGLWQRRFGGGGWRRWANRPLERHTSRCDRSRRTGSPREPVGRGTHLTSVRASRPI